MIHLVEATIPFNHYETNITYTGHLHMTIKKLKGYDPDIITLARNQLPRIMDDENRPEEWKLWWGEKYEEIREFYGLFYEKNTTIDPYGNQWIKTYENSRGTQIWEKK